MHTLKNNSMGCIFWMLFSRQPQ